MSIEEDNVESLSRKDTAHKLPLLWVVLFVGLIAWGVYYYYAYTPAFTGWTQDKQLEESLEKLNIN